MDLYRSEIPSYSFSEHSGVYPGKSRPDGVNVFAPAPRPGRNLTYRARRSERCGRRKTRTMALRFRPSISRRGPDDRAYINRHLIIDAKSINNAVQPPAAAPLSRAYPWVPALASARGWSILATQVSRIPPTGTGPWPREYREPTVRATHCPQSIVSNRWSYSADW